MSEICKRCSLSIEPANKWVDIYGRTTCTDGPDALPHVPLEPTSDLADKLTEAEKMNITLSAAIRDLETYGWLDKLESLYPSSHCEVAEARAALALYAQERGGK